MTKKPPRICPECGGDRYLARRADRDLERSYEMQRAARRMAAEAGVAKFQMDILKMDHEQRTAGMQRKITKQARVIRRLEERVKELGGKPYDGAISRDQTAPGAEFDEEAGAA